MKCETVGLRMDADWHTYTDKELCHLLYTYRVLYLKAPGLDAGAFHDVCARFGTPWGQYQYEMAKERDIVAIDDVRRTTLYFHNSYNALSGYIGAHADVANEVHAPPLPNRALYLLSLPEQYTGGHTFFTDLCAVYKQLDPALIAQYANHEILYHSWQRMGTHRRWFKLVQHHPYTGEPFMMLNHCEQRYPWVVGFRDGQGHTVPLEEVQHLNDLHQSLSYYAFPWEESGDLVIMSNLGLLHGREALTVDPTSTVPRAMWRCTIDHNIDPHYILPVQVVPDIEHPFKRHPGYVPDLA